MRGANSVIIPIARTTGMRRVRSCASILPFGCAYQRHDRYKTRLGRLNLCFDGVHALFEWLQNDTERA